MQVLAGFLGHANIRNVYVVSIQSNMKYGEFGYS